MYITINDVIDEARIDLSYPIKGKESLEGTRSAEITIVSMFGDNVQYWLQGSIEVLSVTGKKIVLNKGVLMGKELDSLIGVKMKLRMDDHDGVLRTSMLANGTKMVISLEELDNSDNLEDGRPSNTLFAYYVTSPEYYMHFEPCTPQYKTLKNGTITSLTLKITDQAGNIITDRPGTTVVLHIQ